MEKTEASMYFGHWRVVSFCRQPRVTIHGEKLCGSRHETVKNQTVWNPPPTQNSCQFYLFTRYSKNRDFTA